MKTCRNCRALAETGSLCAVFTCTRGVPVLEVDVNEAEYDQRLGKFVTIKPAVKCKKLRTNKELCDFKSKLYHIDI